MAMTKDNVTYLTNEKRSFKLGIKVVVCACNLPNSHPMSAPQWQQHKSQAIVAWHIQNISWDIIQLKTRWVSVNKSQHLNGNPKGSRKSNITKYTSFRYLLRWLINKNSWLKFFLTILFHLFIVNHCLFTSGFPTAVKVLLTGCMKKWLKWTALVKASLVSGELPLFPCLQICLTLSYKRIKWNKSLLFIYGTF